jgi:hypothetical protein
VVFSCQPDLPDRHRFTDSLAHPGQEQLRHSPAKSQRRCPEARTPLSGPRPRTPTRDREKRGSVQGRPGRARPNKALQRTRLDPDGDDVHEYWTRLWKTTSSSSPGSPLSLCRSAVWSHRDGPARAPPAGRAVLGEVLVALAAGATHLPVRRAASLSTGMLVRQTFYLGTKTDTTDTR